MHAENIYVAETACARLVLLGHCSKQRTLRGCAVRLLCCRLPFFRYGSSVANIMKWNKLRSGQDMYLGKSIVVDRQAKAVRGDLNEATGRQRNFRGAHHRTRRFFFLTAFLALFCRVRFALLCVPPSYLTLSGEGTRARRAKLHGGRRGHGGEPPRPPRQRPQGHGSTDLQRPPTPKTLA